MPTTAITTPSPAALVTLRYWTPGPFANDYCGSDPEAHEAAAYDGLAECYDDGLLAPAGERYRTTPKGMRLLADLAAD